MLCHGRKASPLKSDRTHSSSASSSIGTRGLSHQFIFHAHSNSSALDPRSLVRVPPYPGPRGPPCSASGAVRICAGFNENHCLRYRPRHANDSVAAILHAFATQDDVNLCTGVLSLQKNTGKGQTVMTPKKSETCARTMGIMHYVHVCGTSGEGPC